MPEKKTHYRSVFNSPYLSSQDITEPTILTVSHVTQEIDKTKKTKDFFNTAYFKEKEIRKGEDLHPMILNATNSRTMKNLTGSPFIEDWNNVPVMIYVDHSVRFGRDTVEGLRISTERPNLRKPELTPANVKAWSRALDVYAQTETFSEIEKHMEISDGNRQLIQEHVAKEKALINNPNT
jgi:hypothetical protein